MRRRPLLRSLSLSLALALGAAACSTGPSPHEVASEIQQGQYDAASKDLEAADQSVDPDDFDGHLKLGELHYALARKSLDGGKQNEYVDHLSKAQSAFLAAARIEPTSPRPHTWLGIITAYEGDLNGSETSFRNALKLALRDEPAMRSRYQHVGGTYYSNLAQIAVYQGDLNTARRYLDKATKTGAPQDEIDRISVLLAWKENDMVEARDVFSGAVTLSKDFATTWDDAPLPKKMETFDDFAATCCQNPTCGPHMEHACQRERQPVARHELDAATVQEQTRIERERRQTLREIYQKQKAAQNVEITVEDEPNAPATTPPPATAPAPEKSSGGKR